MSFFSHLGKSESPMVFQLHIHDLTSINSSEALQCFLTRNKKSYQTRMVLADGHSCNFDEFLSFVSTIYGKRNNKEGGSNVLDKKVYTILIKNDTGKGPRLSLSGASGLSKSRVSNTISLTTDIDLAEMSHEKDWGKEVTRIFPLKDLSGEKMMGGGSGSAAPILKITFKVAPVKKGMEAMATEKPSGHRGHQHSLSLSAASPINQNANMGSFSRPLDETSPDLATRPLGGAVLTRSPSHTNRGGGGDKADLVSKNLAHLARVGSNRHLGYDDDPAPSPPPARTPDEDHMSYAVEDDPPPTSTPPLPDTRTTTATPIQSKPQTPAPEEEQPPTPNTESERKKYEKRRSETQIFNQIMVDAVHDSREASGSITSPVSLSRRPSVPLPASSPMAQSRRASEFNTPHSRLRVVTDHRTDTAASSPTIDELGTGRLQSYADLDEDDLPPVPTPSAPLDVDDDGDGDGGVGGSSFADRHAGLTVEDIMAPGFSTESSTHTSESNTPSNKRKKGRTISMFNNSDGAAAVEQILRPQTTTTTRGSAIGNFFGINSSRKASSSKQNTLERGFNLETSSSLSSSTTSQTSQPGGGGGGSSAPRTPQQQTLTSASSFTQPASSSSITHHHLGHHAQSMPSVHGNADESFTGRRSKRTGGGNEDESPASTLDVMLDGNNSMLSALTDGGSAQHSRHVSRSSSPSRLGVAGSTTVSGGGGGGLMVGSAVGPSPRATSSLTKQFFPHTSPAKHSQAHTSLRATRTAGGGGSGGSPYGSFNKDDMLRQLASGMPPPPSNSPLDANGAEIGSYAAWKAATKANKLRASARTNSGASGSGGSTDLSAMMAASKTLPRPTVSSTVPKTNRPFSSLSREQAALLTGSNPMMHRQSLSIGGGGNGSLGPGLAPSTSGATLSEMVQHEQSFQQRNFPAVQLLLASLHIPDLAVEPEQDPQAGPWSPTGQNVATTTTATTSTSSSSGNTQHHQQQQSSSHSSANTTNAHSKGLWSSIKNGFGSSNNLHASNHGITSTPSNVSHRSSPSAAAGAASPSPLDDMLKTSFYHGSPTWPAIVLRCLSAWDAFAVSSVVGDDGQIVRIASRSWILSMILAHLNHTCIYLCARTAAGQKQHAMTFFLSHLNELIQLVEGFSKTSHAPTPYPNIPTPELVRDNPSTTTISSSSSSSNHTSGATYEASLHVANFPISFASSGGLYSIAFLADSSSRVCEIARSRLPNATRTPMNANSNHRSNNSNGGISSGSNSASNIFPYAVSLGVDTYTWFTAHLRQMFHSTLQCLLETILTEVEMVDPISILSTSSSSPITGEVGFEYSMDQLLHSYTKIWYDLVRQHVSKDLRQHLMRCLFSNLNVTLFNHVLSFVECMKIEIGMRLKIIHTSIFDWIRTLTIRCNVDEDDEDDADDPSHSSQSSTELDELLLLAQKELSSSQQLALLLLMDKQTLNIRELSELCPSLTPVSLYHLLLNYLPRHGQESEEVVNEGVLEALTEYQTYFLSKDNNTKGGKNTTLKFPILFPAWKVHQQQASSSGMLNDSSFDSNDDVDDVWLKFHRSSNLSTPPPQQLQKALLDTDQPIRVPRLSATHGQVQNSILLRLSDVPIPSNIREAKQYFAFLDEPDQLTLPVTKG